MKKIYSIIIVVLIMSVQAFSQGDNPLLKAYGTPFNVPPFDKIKNEHYIPAIKTAMEKHNGEIKAIIENKQAPTFQNTVEALEYSGELLNDVLTVFYNISSANTNDEMEEIANQIAPMLSSHQDNITLNKNLFKKIEAVYKQKDKLNLQGEQAKLLEDTYKNFVKNGVGLEGEKQEQLKKVNSDLSVLTTKFGQNLLSETNAYKLIIDNEKDLAGLPKNLIDAASEKAKKQGLEGKWVFTLHNPSVMPFLQYAQNRELREKIQQAYINRGNNNNEQDNKEILEKITNLRLERSKLLGFDSYADYVLVDNMAKKPENVYNLLDQIWPAAIKVAKQEAKDMQEMIDNEKAGFKLEAWDWRYYAEKIRAEKYNLDEEVLKPYFALNNVRDGIFLLVNKLYGITFKELKDVPKYHPEAVVYDVLDADGSHLAILYMDFYARESKRGGAWMTNYREQYTKNGKNVPPIISLVCNFSRPNGDQPALLTFDEVETFFHEFGHGLHGMFSKCTYRSIAGTNVPRDFVELPSQIMENWCTEPDFLKLFAKHYQTGEVIPKALVDKIVKSSHFGQGFATTEYLAASYLDLSYHTLKSPLTEKALDFEKEALDKIGLIPEIVSRYRSTYFNHIWAGGYACGYYAYIWAEVLDADAFNAFKEKGIFDKTTATSFRKNVLERGYTEDPMILYKRFRGQEPTIEPLLKRRGLD